MNNRNRIIPIILKDALFPLITYLIVIGFLSFFLFGIKSVDEFFTHPHDIAFYSSLAVLVIITLDNILHKRGRRALLIPIVILVIGLVIFSLAYEKHLWEDENLSFNINAMSLGLSIIAIGLAFLFVFSPRGQSQENKKLEEIGSRLDNIDKNVEKLNVNLNGIEDVITDTTIKLGDDLKKLKNSRK